MTAASVLSVLRRGRGQWISVDRLRSELQMGLTELQGKLAELRQMGYEVEEEPVRGLRLSGVGGGLSSELIEKGLGTCYIGSKVLVYQVTDSTNNVAWAYMAEPGYDGLAVFAEQQRIGRGRLGRCWESAEGSSVLCSILLQDGGAWESRALTLLVGLSVAETIERVCQVAARIKWPNDVLVDGRKVAGTMIEGRSEGVRRDWVLGIGINCQQRSEEFSGELLRLIQDFGLEERVRLAGFLEGDALAQEYRAAHILVHPTLEEGYGMVVAEAMQWELPVVVSRVGGIPEVVGNHDLADLLVPPADPVALGGALRRLFGNPRFYARMREASSNRAAELPTWDEVGERFHQVLLAVARRK